MDCRYGILHIISEGQIVDIVIVLRLIYFKANLLSAAVMACRSFCLGNPVNSDRHICDKVRGAVFSGYGCLDLLPRSINHGPVQVLHLFCRIQGKLRSCLLCPDAFIHTVFGNRHACGYCLYINHFIIRV